MSIATIDRPLPLKRRLDLVEREQWFAGRRHFVLHDPLALTYAWLTEIEHAVWKLLDGRASAGQVQALFAVRFAPRQLTPHELQSFLVQLHRQGLVISDAPGQGDQLAARRQRKERFNLLRFAEQLVAWRWRGVNPQPLLNWLDPLLGWLFSRLGLAIWTAVVLLAGVLIAFRWDEAARRIPDAQAWLAGANLLWLPAAMILVKTMHELGHALAARRMGCRCREIGVQLFFLLPCLYTNVSDVWLLPSKWRRMAVSAAGIYVEVLLAAIAALVWLRAEPGVLSSLCLNVMLVATLGTLLLNGNPLLRYDGYYLLADLAEFPNLEQTSRNQLLALLGFWCAGLDEPRADYLPRGRRLLLAAYAAPALVYRGALLVGVYLAVRSLLAPFRLEPLSDVLLAIAVLGMVVPLAARVSNQLVRARRQNALRPWRLVISGLVVAGLIAAALLVPLPQRITAPLVIEPKGASQIYATVSGTLQTALPAGTNVQRGQTIVQLASPELSRDAARLASELRRQELHITALEAARGDDPAALAALPAAQQSLADLRQRLAHVQGLIGKLTLAAPQDGVVLPPPQRRQTATPQQLAGWTGTPLEPANRGCLLEAGTLVCLIGRPGAVQALAIVEQGDVPLVQLGGTARLAVGQSPRGVLHGVVESVAQAGVNDLPLHLTATGALPQKLDAAGKPLPLQIAYQVRISLVDPPPVLLPGATGRVQLPAARETLAARMARWLGRTFRFQY
jgi:putative peptide zinc metalloprotease protein